MYKSKSDNISTTIMSIYENNIIWNIIIKYYLNNHFKYVQVWYK